MLSVFLKFTSVTWSKSGLGRESSFLEKHRESFISDFEEWQSVGLRVSVESFCFFVSR